MMNKKGQALVEFIIILPILIFILFAIIDYGMISYNRNRLEGILSDVGKMYINNESQDEIDSFIKSNDKDIEMKLSYEEKYVKIILSKKYNYITPGLNKIFNSNMISIERKMYSE